MFWGGARTYPPPPLRAERPYQNALPPPRAPPFCYLPFCACYYLPRASQLFGVAGALSFSIQGVKRSIGIGKIVVELFSVATSTSVCR